MYEYTQTHTYIYKLTFFYVSQTNYILNHFILFVILYINAIKKYVHYKKMYLGKLLYIRE